MKTTLEEIYFTYIQIIVEYTDGQRENILRFYMYAILKKGHIFMFIQEDL